MKNIGIAILAVCLGTLGSMASQAQSYDTAYGTGAFPSNTGNYNSAFGYSALGSNFGGLGNTANGYMSLYYNTTGGFNTASGYQALLFNTSGWGNVAYGTQALFYSTAGSYNTASGFQSLYNNANGGYNAAFGVYALLANAGGYWNVAIGPYSLYNNTTGGENIGIGYAAGYYNPVGSSNNIDIGSYGSQYDDNAIRIGTLGTQTAFFAAGIRGTRTGASNAVEVMIDSNGQLGTVNSSIRFKEDVHDMAAASDGLMRLRPVTYRYKQPYADGSKPIDYGLIAEEVAEVYPDLVVKGADGQIQTVQYQKLTPMLLNEVQKEHQLLEQQEATIEKQETTIDKQGETIQQLKNQLATLPLLEKRLAALEAAQPSATMLETRLVTK